MLPSLTSATLPVFIELVLHAAASCDELPQPSQARDARQASRQASRQAAAVVESPLPHDAAQTPGLLIDAVVEGSLAMGPGELAALEEAMAR